MKEKNCEVLVLGGGGGGLVAGVRAAEAGKKVIILEKAGFLGGGMLLASTMRTFRSKWQKERNIPDYSNAFIRNMMDLTRWKLDPKLVKNAVLATGAFFDWYSEHEDPEELSRFEPRPYVFENPACLQIGPQVDTFHKGSGAMFMKCMIRYGKELGVEMLTEHAAKEAIVKDGKIAAILADTPEGKVQFNCDICIIASSSWINNREIVEKVEPRFLTADVQKNAHRNPAYTGDALAIAEQVGAYIDRENFCFRLMGPQAATGDRSNLDTLGHSPSIILVNKLGNRFVAEPLAPRIDPFTTGHILLDQPDAKAYYVYSKDMLEKIIAASKTNGKKEDVDVFGLPEFPDYPELVTWFEKAIKKDPSNCSMGNTIEEAAEQIGISPQNLKATITAYNKSCDEGEDWDFFKDPADMIPLKEGPYFIVGGQLSTDGAFGGIKVNPDMQAYAEDGSSLIEDLYVVGDIASGRHIADSGIKKQVLNDMSWALASGFIAGTNAGRK